MLEPEEDFGTWTMILTSVADSPTEFEMFIPGIERLVSSILETGNLPEPLNSDENKKQFIMSVCATPTRKLLGMSYVDDDVLAMARKFFAIMLKLAAHGIESNDEKYSKLAHDILTNEKAKLYKAKGAETLMKEMLTKAAEEGFLDAAKNAIKGGAANVAVLSIAYTMAVAILKSKETPEEFWAVSMDMLTSLEKMCKEGLRNITQSTLKESLYEVSLDAASEKEEVPAQFVTQWLSIFELCINSDIFEKRLFGYCGIQGFILKAKMEKAVIEWFQEPKRIMMLVESDIHSGFIPAVTAILPILGGQGMLSDDFLASLWEMHKVQHSVQLLQFFTIFDQIATTLPAEKIPSFTEMCLNPKEVTPEWIKFVSKLGTSVGKRPDCCASYLLIRNKLFDVVMTSPTPQKEALTNLASMIQYHLNSETFNDLLQKVTRNGFTHTSFQLLEMPVSVCEFDKKEQAVEYVSAAIDLLVSSDENRKTLYGFIFNVCFKNDIMIPEDKLDVLFALSTTCKGFYKFANDIIEGEMCSFDFIEQFIMNFNAENVTYDFVLFVQKFVMKVNALSGTYQITSLPLKHESILWHWSSKKSKETTSFANILCTIYAANDGVELSDEKMIDTFVENWLDLVDKPDVDPKSLLNILRCLIQTIESTLDVSLYGVKKHSASSEENFVTVSVTGLQRQTYVLPGETTGGALKHRISKLLMLPRHKFVVKYGQNMLQNLRTLKSIANDKKQVSVYVSKADKEGAPERERTTIPSAVIGSTPAIDVIFNFLRQNVTAAKNLLDLLPTVTSIKFLLDGIPKKNTVRYDKLFPHEFPAVFEYNFGAFKTFYNESIREHVDRSGGFTYIIQSFTKDLASVIIAFLTTALTDELKLKYGQQIVDVMIPVLASLTSPDDKNVFLEIAKYVKVIYTTKDMKLSLNESMYAVVESMLFAEEYVRNDASSLFAAIDIPISVFIDLLPKLADANQETFFSAMIPHIKEYNEIVFNMCLEKLDSKDHLAVLEKLLKEDLLSESQKTTVTTSLISRYLQLDEQNKEKDCFVMAARCLSYMQNDVLMQHIHELHQKRTHIYDDWRINGDSSQVSKSGYSGLVNLGATCFLNSTLQQFFAIVPLRNKIIMYEGDDEFMIELRTFFAKMLLSKGHSVTTEPLVAKWKGWDGEPLNPRLQQDASEFAQMLIDKLESGLGKEYTNEMFGGTTVNTIDGISDEYHSTSNQPFTTLPLAVCGATDIPSAMELFQAPDYFTGSNQYKAESLNKKIDAKKFASIGKLPKCLVVQLGRFEYNYYTGNRKKINSAFKFPLELDVEPWMSAENKDQVTKYVLNGVILHSGTADYGHYFSYIKDARGSGKWYNFNDSSVSEISVEDVMKNSYGDSAKSGYVLFYTRTDFNNTDDGTYPEISSELKTQIARDNALNDEQRVFCSSGYFELMKSLGRSDNCAFVGSAIRYYFDTFSFTSQITHAADLGPFLVEQLSKSEELRQMLSNFLAEGPFVYPLVYCPNDRTRQYAREMIMTLDPNDIPDNFIFRMAGLLSEDLVKYYNHLNEYFALFCWILKSSEKAKQYATETVLVEKFCKFISVYLPGHLEKNPKLREAYFYSCIDLTNLFNAIAVVGPPAEFIEYILSEDTFKLIMGSKADVASIVNLLQSFGDSERVTAFVSNFASRCGIHVNFAKIVTLIFDVLGGDALDLVARCRFKVVDTSAGDFDFAVAYASMLMGSPSFGKHLMENLDKWLLKFLLSEKDDSRIVCMYIIALLVRHESFKDLMTFPTHSQKWMFNNVVITPTEPTEELIQNANLILDYLISDIDSTAEKIPKVPRVAQELVSVVSKLSCMTNRAASSCLIPLLKKLVGICHPLEGSIINLFRELMKREPESVTVDLILECLPGSEFGKDLVEVTRMIHFFTTFDNKLDELDFPKEEVQRYLKIVPFNTTQAGREFQFNSVQLYIRKFSLQYPDLVLAQIKENMDAVMTKCYSAVLVALEAMNEKLPVLNHLPAAISSSQNFTADVLISKAFAVHSGETNAIDIIKLLNLPSISQEARDLIWNFTFDLKPSLEDFSSAYTTKGDYVNVAKYLIMIGGDEVKDKLVDCCASSIDAFVFAYETMKAKFMDAIIDKSFALRVMKMENGEHHDVISDYVQLLSQHHDKCEIVAPLVASLAMHVNFLNDVLEDVCDGGITPEDTAPLVGLLTTLSNVQADLQPIAENLQKLKCYCENEEVLKKVNLPTDLINLI